MQKILFVLDVQLIADVLLTGALQLSVCTSGYCRDLFDTLRAVVVVVISPHGIAMPKGFYRCRFFFLSSSFFSFRRLISEVTERISTKRGHIFTHDCYLKNLVWTPPRHLPSRYGGKNAFLGTDFKLWPNISLQRNMVSNQQ